MSAETFFPEPDVAAAQLALQWNGKRVSTADWTLPSDAGPFGAGGVVVAFFVKDGRVWLQSDWGYDWVITPATEIVEVAQPDTEGHAILPPQHEDGTHSWETRT